MPVFTDWERALDNFENTLTAPARAYEYLNTLVEKKKNTLRSPLQKVYSLSYLKAPVTAGAFILFRVSSFQARQDN